MRCPINDRNHSYFPQGVPGRVHLECFYVPEEKLLLAILTKQESPLSFDDKSIWCGNSGYYVDGKKMSLSIRKLNAMPLEYIQETKTTFDKYRPVLCAWHLEPY